MSVIADLLVRVGADVTGLTSGLGRASDAVSSAGASMVRTGGALTVGVSAPLLAIGTSAISAASTFQSSMNTFQAVTGATAGEMAALQARAIALGDDITLPGTSAADAAVAMTELARAGMSVEESLAAAEGVLRMSAAAQISNEQAATITAAALNTFGLAGGEASRVADLLAAGANASAASVQDMGAAIQQSGSVAAMAGVPIEDLTTSIALMANAGVVGSDAGTSMKTMLMRLQAPTNEAAGLMRDLGISVFDSSGQMRPMRDLVGQFGRALDGMTQEQRNAALATIFGTDAIRAANIVLSSGTDAWDEMSTAVNRQGAATDLSAVKMDGLGGAFEAFKSTVETVLLTAALPFLNTLETLVRGAGDFIDNLGSLNPELRNAGIAIGVVLAVAGPLALGLGAILTAVGALLSPIGLLIIGIGLVAAAFASGTISMDTVRPILDGIGLAFATLRTVAETVLASIQAFWMQHGATILASAQTTWNMIWGVVSGVVNALWSVIQSVFGVVQTFLATHGEQIEAFFVMAWTAIQTIIQTVLAIVQATVIPILTGIAQFISEHSDEILTVLSVAWNAIQTVVTVVLAAIQGILGVVLALIKGDWEGAWNVVKATAETIWNAIKGFLETLWNAVRGQAETIWNGISSFFTTILTAIETTFQTIWNGISSFFTTILTAIETTFQTIWNGISTFLTTILTGIETTFQTIWNGISSFFTTILTAIETTATTIWNGISTFLSTILTGIETTFQTIWNGISTFLSTTWTGIKTTATEMWDSIRLAIRAIVIDMQGMFTYRLNLIRDFLQDTWNQVKETARRVWEEIKGSILGVLDGLVGEVFGRGAAMVQRFADGVISALNTAIDVARRLAEELRNLLPGSDAKTGPLRDLGAAGRAFATRLGEGISQGSRDAVSAAMQLSHDLARALPQPELGLRVGGAGVGGLAGGSRAALAGQPAAQGAPVTINVYNPRAQASEESIRREMRYLAAGIW